MNERNGKPMILEGCRVLPPLVPCEAAERSNTEGRAKGKPARHKAGRFAALNAFIDATLRSLSRAEAAVWLILYRDTKRDGLARIASRLGTSGRKRRSHRAAGGAESCKRPDCWPWFTAAGCAGGRRATEFTP